MKIATKAFWLFGRSGAGKTTLGTRLRDELIDRKFPTVYLDGDELRSKLCSDLGFEPEARLENHRRIAQIARMLVGQGFNVVVSTMAPEHRQRDLVSQILGDKLIWIYIHASLDACIARDPKGIYKLALEGHVKQLINYPFEVPRPHECENYINTVARNSDESYLDMLDTIKSHLNDFTI